MAALPLVFAGCRAERRQASLEQVSGPYLDRYGQPEDVYRYDSGDYHSVDWWWWSKGFRVAFIDSPYDEIPGWSVDSTWSFPPIN